MGNKNQKIRWISIEQIVPPFGPLLSEQISTQVETSLLPTEKSHSNCEKGKLQLQTLNMKQKNSSNVCWKDLLRLEKT